MDASLPCILDEDDEISLTEFLASQKGVQSNVQGLNVLPNVEFLNVMPKEAYDVSENACASMHLMSMDDITGLNVAMVEEGQCLSSHTCEATMLETCLPNASYVVQLTLKASE